MALVDSIAGFAVRVVQLKLTEHQGRMTAAGVTTFAELAFFSGFLPGGTEDVFNTSLALPLLGAADHVQRPALRRLFIEAYTLSSADLQRRVEPRNELAAAPMPPAEREARLKNLLARLPGYCYYYFYSYSYSYYYYYYYYQ